MNIPTQGPDPFVSHSHIIVEEIRLGELHFARIFDFYMGPLAALKDYDGVIIEVTSLECTRNMISKIRLTMDQPWNLMPLFLRVDSWEKFPAGEMLFDGRLNDFNDPNAIVALTNMIRGRIREITWRSDLTYEWLGLFKIITFMYSRNRKNWEVEFGKNGISYPFLSEMIRHSGDTRLFYRLIELMEKENLVDGYFTSALYVCSNCLSDHLLYREVCPACASDHIKSEEIVHHFRCAFMGPLSDFQKSGEWDSHLHCPKCHHDLKHIGVDYDKPAMMHHCQNCHKHFQQYGMKARCLSCNHDQEVEHLVKKELKSFHFTEKAWEFIRQPSKTAPQTESPSDMMLLEWNLFLKVLDYEKSRNKADHGFVVKLHFQDMELLQRQLGEQNIKKLFLEISQVLETVQRKSDVRCLRLPDLYFTLFQVTKEDADIITQRTVFLINHLLFDNLRLKNFFTMANVYSLWDDLPIANEVNFPVSDAHR